MTSDQDFKKIFGAHKSEIPDNGFSEHLTRQLSPRSSILPQVVMVVCIMAGLMLTLFIQGIEPLYLQLKSIFTAIYNSEIPSIASLVTYLGGLLILGTIGLATAQAGME